MKIKTIKSAGLLLTSLLTTSSLHAVTVTWTSGGSDNAWTNGDNWGGSTPTGSDTATIDTDSGATGYNVDLGAATFQTTADLHILGNGGTINMTQSGGRFEAYGGFLAEDSVSLTLTAPLYIGQSSSGTYEWNSTGTLTTQTTNSLGLFMNIANSAFVINNGTVDTHGGRFFRGNRVNQQITINGGTLNTTNLFEQTSTDSDAINMTGGNLDQASSMTWNALADINLTDGVFTVGGDITFGANAGELNFLAGSTGSFVSGHTQAELEGFIGSGNITKDAGDMFVYTDNGSTRTLSIVAVPEPSSTALFGLGGLALILRRRK